MQRCAAVATVACSLLAVVCFLFWPQVAVDGSVYILPGKVPAAFAPEDRSVSIGEHRIADFMPRWDPARQFLFFSHIPRTSGGTFCTLLSAVFSPRFTHPASSYAKALTGSWTAFLNATPAEWVWWKVLYTHEDFSLVRYIPREVALLVWLRTPAIQRRSLYDVPVQKKFRRGHPTVVDWIGTVDYPIDYQVEWVAGVLTNWPYSKAPENYVRTLLADRRAMLARAVQNLASTTFFGITERYNESICLFYYSHQIRPRVIGKDYKTIHRVSNRSANHEDLQRPLLALEYEFLRVAHELLDKRLEWMKKDYLTNARRMQRYVAPECADVLPAVDWDRLPPLTEEELAELEADDVNVDTHRRGDPAYWYTTRPGPRRRRTRPPSRPAPT